MALQDMTSHDFNVKLRQDLLFVDYFNKFCCLPVFGQRVTFLHKTNKYVFDPPPLRIPIHGVKVANEYVQNWLYRERLPLFIRSVVSSEYNLCQSLSDMNFIDQSENKHDNSTGKGIYCMDELKQHHLVRVHHMKRFIRFVESSKGSGNYIRFWTDVDRLKCCDTTRRRIILRAIQQKYFMKTSSSCLPYYLLDIVYPARNAKDAYGFDYDITMKLKDLVLTILHCYWLPKYLLSCANISKSDKIMLRKLETLASMKNNNEMMHRALHESRYVRHIPNHEEIIRRESAKEQEENPILIYLQEDDDNILIRDETKQEIWQDEKVRGRIGRHGSEMLGSENIEFIHDHIFGKESEVQLEEASKDQGSKETEKYHLFPGRIISVKGDEDQSLLASQEQSSSSSTFSNILSESHVIIDSESSTLSSGAYDGDQSCVTTDKYQSSESLDPETKLWNVVVTQSSSDLVNESQGQPQIRRFLSQIDEEAPISDELQRHRLSENTSQDRGSGTRRKRKEKRNKQVAPSSIGSKSCALPDIVSTKPPVCPRRSRSAISRQEVTSSHVRKSTSAIVRGNEKISSKLDILPEVVTSSQHEVDSRKSVLSSISSESMTTTSSLSFGEAPLSNDSSRKSSSIDLSDVTDDFLRQAKPDMKLSEILSSDEAAAYPFRSFLATRCQPSTPLDHNSCGDFDKSPTVDMATALNFWREIEKLRTTFFTMTSSTLSSKFQSLVRSFASDENGPFRWVAGLTIYDDAPFPMKLETLQREIEKMIESEWIEFAKREQKKFRTGVVTTDKMTFKRRYSFPNCLPEVRQLPILCKPLLTNEPQGTYEEFEELAKRGNLGNLTNDFQGQMRYRSSRAHRLLMETTGRNVADDIRYSEFVGEDSSDDEGGIPLIKPKVFSRLPELDTKSVALQSVKEYPGPGIDYKQCTILRLQNRQKVNFEPLYMRPIRKHGVVLRRPQDRPKSMAEVVRDPLQFEFFKRYMKMHKSEAPLLFWKSVELLKRTENPLIRQKKAQQILKKFFSNVAGGGVMLQCDSDVIKEVANVDTVTTSMLVQTSQEVFKSMEKNWGQRYFNTFHDVAEDKEEETYDKKLGLNAFTTKLSHIWEVFSEFMRRAARFIECMKHTNEYEQFSGYLRGIPDRPDTQEARGDASSTAHMFKRFQTVVYKHMNTDLDIKHKTKEICGRKVTLEFLANDLGFWLEVDRYVSMSDNIQNIVSSGCYEQHDTDVVREKSERIVKCFLDSYVPPKTRVNVDNEIADAITKNVYGGVFDRAIFHEGVLAVFPILLHYWKMYRQEKFVYKSKRQLRAERRNDVMERRRRIVKKSERRRKRLLQKVPRSQISLESDATNRPSSSALLPDYVDGLCKRKEPYDKVKGLLHSDPPTLHFSLEHGLKLILPPRRRLADRFEDPNDDQFFLNVWTRGAKVVNVFREGSDPKLVNLDETKKAFKVKCDMLNK